MRKLKLLMAACALTLGSMTANAREDVTSTYLEDAALENENGKWGLVSNGGNHAWDGTNKYHESWHNTFTLTQTTAALPAGYYQLSIQAAVEGGTSTSISLQATSGGNSSVAAYPKYSTHSSYSDMAAWWAADASHTGNRDLNRIFTTVYVEEGQTLTATFKQTANNQWFVYGQMQLHKLTDAEGRYAQILEAVYNPMTNLDMSGGRYKQRFENYTGGDVSGVIGKRLNKTISSLPNGKYNVTLNGGASYTSENSGVSGGGASDNKTVFFANNATTNVTVSDRTVISNSDFTDYTASGGLVTDGNLEIGFENKESGANWFVGSVKYIELAEPYISTIATEIPAATATALTANKWYKFTAASTDNYSFTTTTIDDIICTTTDNLLSEATGTTADATMALTAGTTYYIKSSSAQTLTISPQAFSYTVGEATADVAYIQPGRTVTVSYESLGTDNPSPTLVKDFSSVTFDGKAIDFTATDNGFTFTVPANLIASNDYELRIPASAIGYSDGEGTFNVAQTITLKTPAVFDGEYCLYDATNKLFLGRGCAYGTEAAADKYGIPFNLKTDAEGKSTIEFVDWTGVYLFSTKPGEAAGMYTDNASTGWTFVPVTGGFYLKDFNGEFYAKVDNGGSGYYAHTVAGTSTATVWTLKTKAERDAIIAAYPTDNISNVITASGISTTADAFTTYLSSNYQAIDKTSSIGTATFAGSVGDWTWSQVRGQGGQPAYGENFAEVWNATGSFTQTIDKAKLPAGIYKVTVQGYERRKANDAATALYTAGYNNVSTYLSANGEQVRFTDWNEVDGKPTNTGGAVTAFGNEEAVNEVYVYLDGATDLTLTVKKPNYIWDNWAIFNNFTLTYYQPVETVTVTAAGYATYVSDNDLDFTNVEGLTAYRASVSGKTITFNKETTVPAGEGVLLKGEGTFKVPVTTGVTPWDADYNAFIRGTGAAVASEDGGKYNFILNNGSAGVGFYKANGQTVATNRAYLQTDVAASRLNLVFVNEEVTGINTMKAVQYSDAIYNLNGQRVNKAQKGLFIKGGKKFVK